MRTFPPQNLSLVTSRCCAIHRPVPRCSIGEDESHDKSLDIRPHYVQWNPCVRMLTAKPHSFPTDFFFHACFARLEHVWMKYVINCKLLCGIIELFDLSNPVQTPACFKKDWKPSLLDVILTNAKTNCIKPQNFSTGVSDCHNMIGVLITSTMQKNEKQLIQYRSFRTFDIRALNNDLQHVEFLGSDRNHENCSIDTIYDKFESDIVLFLTNTPPLNRPI